MPITTDDNFSDTSNQYVESFMQKYSSAITHLGAKSYDYSTSPVALNAFRHQVSTTLNSAFKSFTSKTTNDLSELDRYLYSTLKYVSLKIKRNDKRTSLICPGCKYRKQTSFLVETSKGLTCADCEHAHYQAQTEEDKKFCAVFIEHSSTGYRCQKCSRFIPASAVDQINCPYPDCHHTNALETIKPMPHPFIWANKGGNVLSTSEPDLSTQAPDMFFDTRETTDLHLKLLTNCIEEQIKTLHFKGFPSTYTSRLCMYRAFQKLLSDIPEDMIPYLMGSRKNNRVEKIQSKIFQLFTQELEAQLPFSYSLHGKKYSIAEITDPNLHLFAGETTFQAEVPPDYRIPNQTQEIYTGGRGGYYHLPYYIGKLLDVKDLKQDRSILNQVVDYSCVHIQLQPTIEPFTPVEVKHLKIVPHYSAGGFAILNRLKKKITERMHIILKNHD